MMKGLAPQTSQLFDAITRLECIKPFVLVGGTALSLQIDKRMSEDLDFMRWKQGPKDRLEVGWPQIKRELETIGSVESIEIGSLSFVEFVVSGVKLSFYAAPRTAIPEMKPIPFRNNLRVADIRSIGAMKMEAMLHRNKFRDFYDIYCILQEGIDINEMIAMALAHSGHILKTKNLMAMLTNGEIFRKDNSFLQLQPAYDVTAFDIQEYIKQKLLG